MRRPFVFPSVETDLQRALDTAKCETCGQMIQFDLDHLRGVTLEKCGCHGWRVMARRVAPPIPKRDYGDDATARLPKAAQAKRISRRRTELLALIPAAHEPAVPLNALLDLTEWTRAQVVYDLRCLVRSGYVRRQEVSQGRFKVVTHVYQRAA
jgi:hypothetical protein